MSKKNAAKNSKFKYSDGQEITEGDILLCTSKRKPSEKTKLYVKYSQTYNCLVVSTSANTTFMYKTLEAILTEYNVAYDGEYETNLFIWESIIISKFYDATKEFKRIQSHLVFGDPKIIAELEKEGHYLRHPRTRKLRARNRMAKSDH